jgi:hypothetical protein
LGGGELRRQSGGLGVGKVAFIAAHPLEAECGLDGFSGILNADVLEKVALKVLVSGGLLSTSLGGATGVLSGNKPSLPIVVLLGRCRGRRRGRRGSLSRDCPRRAWRNHP